MGFASERACAALALAVAIIFAPLFAAFAASPYRTSFPSSSHPLSPHTPPELTLTAVQLQRWRADGMLVLRGVLPPLLAARMAASGADLFANRTLQCDLSKWAGPPIFHRCESSLSLLVPTPF